MFQLCVKECRVFVEFGVLNYLIYLVGVVFIIFVSGFNMFFVLKMGIVYGVKKGYLVVVGVFIGDVVLMFLVFVGVVMLIKIMLVLFNVVCYFGVIYLLWFGGKMFYVVLIQCDGQFDVSVELVSVIFKCFLILSLINLKVILFYVLFFVQFIDVNVKIFGVVFFILVLIFEVISFCYMSFLIFFGLFVICYVKICKKLVKFGNSLIGLVFVGFVVCLVILQF